MDLPCSQACENNKVPILQEIRRIFNSAKTILEIGSGSGQHAVFFAQELPHLFWQTSDQINYHSGINSWIDSVALNNLGRPIPLDVMQLEQWPVTSDKTIGYDGMFSANTAHIMPWDGVVAMFSGVGATLLSGGNFVLYGPFNKDGEFTSESNRSFHEFLQNQDNQMGIRDDVMIQDIAVDCGLTLDDDIDMPSNNRILVFTKT